MKVIKLITKMLINNHQGIKTNPTLLLKGRIITKTKTIRISRTITIIIRGTTTMERMEGSQILT
jgi:hypothetical protein